MASSLRLSRQRNRALLVSCKQDNFVWHNNDAQKKQEWI